MKTLYIILAVSGWAWLVALGGFVAYKLRQQRRDNLADDFQPIEKLPDVLTEQQA